MRVHLCDKCCPDNQRRKANNTAATCGEPSADRRKVGRLVR